MKTPSFVRLAQIEKILQADVRWTIDKGPGWSPDHGAHWTKSKFTSACGTCVIGSHVVRHCKGNALQPKLFKMSRLGFSDDVNAASLSLKLPVEFVDIVYHAVTSNSKDRLLSSAESDRLAQQLGWRLRDYGDAYLRVKEMAALPNLKLFDYRRTYGIG